MASSTKNHLHNKYKLRRSGDYPTNDSYFISHYRISCISHSDGCHHEVHTSVIASSSESLIDDPSGFEGVLFPVWKTVVTCLSELKCTRTWPGLIHCTHFGRRLPTLMILAFSPAAIRRGSTVRSLITDRKPLPLMASLRYHFPWHLFSRPSLSTFSKTVRCPWAIPSCLILRVHH